MKIDSSDPTTVVRRAALLIVGLLAVYVAGRTIYIEASKSRLYAAGQAAVTANQWAEAFVQFHALAELDPNDRDARRQLDQIVQPAIQVVPGGQDLKTEIALLRWLAASGDGVKLAAAMDRSVVDVPAGEFTMGSDTGRNDERPQRRVYLDAFAMDRYEITNVQYQRFLKATGRESPPYWSEDEFPPGQANYPVVGVSWPDADAYCMWGGKRLPTEAEWEKACRGSDGRLYPWGNAWTPNRANVDVSAGHTQLDPWGTAWALLRTGSKARGLYPVGSYPDSASPYGIMDLVGNASEWVADWYNWNGYSDWPIRNPVGTRPPWNHSLRGSSWYDPNGSAAWVQEQSRCPARNSSHETQDPRTGFRCARSIP